MFDLAGPRVGQPKAPIWRRLNKNRMQAFLYRNVLLRIAPKKIKRDISRVHAELIGAGRAVWLGEAFPDELPGPLDEMPRAIARGAGIGWRWNLFSAEVCAVASRMPNGGDGRPLKIGCGDWLQPATEGSASGHSTSADTAESFGPVLAPIQFIGAKVRWWPRAGSNRRHRNFSVACSTN